MEFSPSLAHSIIERVGARKEAWLVFDMDGTLAQWKKQKAGDVFSLRPTVIPFLQKLIDSGIHIYFAIYSNNTTKSKVETIASTIESGLNKKSLFDVCFLFYNHFKGKSGEEGLRRLNLNMNVSSLNVKRQAYDTNKTVDSILHGFRAAGAPLTAEDDDLTHLFFFDDVDYPSIRTKIGKNYIPMVEYKAEPVSAAAPAPAPVPAPVPASKSRGTKRTVSGEPKARRRMAKQRHNRTRRN